MGEIEEDPEEILARMNREAMIAAATKPAPKAKAAEPEPEKPRDKPPVRKK